jgi:DNA-binding transcriptional MocR family regulator
MEPIEAARRGAMAEALRRTMPPGTRWTEPIGGLSLWVRLPPGRYADLYEAALAVGVPFAPGGLFVREEGDRHLRLSYGRHAPEVLASAVERLAALVKARIM